MFKNNIYNIDREFDYATIKGIVLKSLEKIAQEAALENTSNVPDRVPIHPKDMMIVQLISNCLPRPSLY
jgi:hypothetical protein